MTADFKMPKMFVRQLLPGGRSNPPNGGSEGRKSCITPPATGAVEEKFNQQQISRNATLRKFTDIQPGQFPELLSVNNK